MRFPDPLFLATCTPLGVQFSGTWVLCLATYVYFMFCLCLFYVFRVILTLSSTLSPPGYRSFREKVHRGVRQDGGLEVSPESVQIPWARVSHTQGVSRLPLKFSYLYTYILYITRTTF
jgi:hypothetical protein